MQQLRQSLLHFCTVLLRRSPTDTGTGVWSQETVALPNWTLNTVFMFFNVRIVHCARTAPIWHSTLSADGLKSRRVVVYVSDWPQEIQATHAGTREAFGFVLVL